MIGLLRVLLVGLILLALYHFWLPARDVMDQLGHAGMQIIDWVRSRI